jgi:hypothetical protein
MEIDIKLKLCACSSQSCRTHSSSSAQFVNMKFISVAAALLPLASGAMYSKEEYKSGAVMSMMMEAKEVRWFHIPSFLVPY